MTRILEMNKISSFQVFTKKNYITIFTKLHNSKLNVSKGARIKYNFYKHNLYLRQ